MNASIALLGLFVVAGLGLAGLLRPDGLPRPARVFLVLAGAGYVLAGLAPADERPGLHVLAAFVVFVGGNIGLLYVERPGMSVATLAIGSHVLTLGTIGLVATALFLGQAYLVFGPGGMERLAVFPLLIWSVLAGGPVASRVDPSTSGAGGSWGDRPLLSFTGRNDEACRKPAPRIPIRIRRRTPSGAAPCPRSSPIVPVGRSLGGRPDSDRACAGAAGGAGGGPGLASGWRRASATARPGRRLLALGPGRRVPTSATKETTP